VAISPDGNVLASSSADLTVRLWNIKDLTKIRSTPIATKHKKGILSISFHPTKKIMALSSADHTFSLWDYTDVKKVKIAGKRIRAHGGSVNAIAIHPDGNFMVTGSSDKTIKVWDIRDLKNIKCIGRPSIRGLIRPLRGHSGAVNSLAFSPDGNFLASVGEKTGTVIWDFSNPQDVQQITSYKSYGKPLTAVLFSGNGRHVFSVGKDINAWDFSDSTQLKNIGYVTFHIDGYNEPIARSLAISPDGQFIVTVGDYEAVKIWTPHAKKGFVTHSEISAHSGHIRSVAFSPDGKFFVTGGADTTIRLWIQEP